MGRLILGILLGIVAAFATIWAVEMVNHLLHPLPAELSMNDRRGLGEYIGGLPPLATALIALAWLLGALVGGLVGAKVAQREWVIGLIAVLVVIAGVANIMMIPHPTVLQIAAIVAPLIGAAIARILYRRRGATTAS